MARGYFGVFLGGGGVGTQFGYVFKEELEGFGYEKGSIILNLSNLLISLHDLLDPVLKSI